MVNVLALCSESPAHRYGGRGTHIDDLGEALKGLVESYHLVVFEHPARRWYPMHEHGYHRSTFRDTPMECIYDNHSLLLCRCLKVIKEHKIDLIHYHDWDVARVAQQLQWIYPEIPIVGTFHLFAREVMAKEGINPEEHPEIFFGGAQEFEGLKNSDAVILCSKHMEALARGMFRVERDYNIIRNGVFAESFLPHRGSGKEKPTVLFAGRYARQKGFDLITEAIAATDRYEWQLLGQVPTPDEKVRENHPYTKRVEELKEKYPGRITHAGWEDEAAKRRFFALADVGIIPSQFEPYGIVGLEFLAAGLPIVSTRAQGLGEFLDDTNSVAMEYSVEGLLSGIERALARKEELRKAGLELAKRMNWEEVAKQTVEVYERTYVAHQRETKGRD